MCALLYDASLLQDDDQVTVPDGGQAVGDHKGRPPLHQLVHTRLDDLLRPGIDGAGRLVKNECRRICDRGARDGEELTLALGEVGPVAGQHGIISLRKAPDKAVRIGELRCTHHFFIRGVELSVPDILPDSVGKQVRILQDDPERPAQIAFFDLVDIDVVVADLTVLNVIEAVDQVCDRRLAGPGGPDEGDLHAGFCMDPDIVQDHLVVPVAEIHAVEGDIPFQCLIGRRITRLVVMLPGPLPGMFLCLYDLPILIPFTVDQHDIAVVRLRFRVHEPENAVCARKRHDDAVELHADLVDRHGKAPVEGQEACEGADRETGVGIDRQDAAHDRADDIVRISELAVDRRDDICECVRPRRALEQLLIEPVKVPDRLLFMAENLDDLFSGHRLLDEAVQLSEVLLLCHEIPSGYGGHPSRNEQHDPDHDERDDGQGNTEYQHHGQDTGDRDQAVQKLRQTLTHHLTQGIDIVRVDGHDIPVCMGVEILDRQALHVFKELRTQAPHRPLGDKSHRARLCIGGGDPDRIEACDAQHRLHQRGKIRVRLPLFHLVHHRRDVGVDQCTREHRPLDIGQNGDHDADCHQDQVQSVKAKDIGQDPPQDLPRILHLRARSAPHPPRPAADFLDIFLCCHALSSVTGAFLRILFLLFNNDAKVKRWSCNPRLSLCAPASLPAFGFRRAPCPPSAGPVAAKRVPKGRYHAGLSKSASAPAPVWDSYTSR